ncbi:MAG: RNA polymerase sigma factor [Candidatus Eisenbacteria bacterium]|nr:RNA polymerase sigma factor [Candidatus Eisenbacteria bacterium]
MDRAIHSVTAAAGPDRAPPQDDRGLAEAIRRGRPRAFDRFFDRYGGPLLGYLTGMVGDRTGAEDLLQETMIRVWRKIDDYRELGAFRSWVFRIATNLALTELRRSRYKQVGVEEIGEMADPEGLNPEEEWEKKERETRLKRALRALPDDHRAVMLLRVRNGMSIREIAETLSLPEGTVKSRIHYAVRRLRSITGGEEETDRGTAL